MNQNLPIYGVYQYHAPQFALNQDPRTFEEILPSCERRQCYVNCRLKLLGGGRCSKGGCVCYAAFFDHTGAPTSRFYPEDNIWYELYEPEKDDIRRAMQSRVPIDDRKPTPRPDYNKPTKRPDYNKPTKRPDYNKPTKRPDYK